MENQAGPITCYDYYCYYTSNKYVITSQLNGLLTMEKRNKKQPFSVLSLTHKKFFFFFIL